MSTSSTVEVFVVCSVRKTSKSAGRQRDPPARPPARGVLLAGEGVGQRPPELEMERVAELVRLGRLVALAAATAALHPMAPERVAPKAGEQVVEDLLADPPAAPRGELQAVAVAGEVARPLELLREVVERVQVAGRLVAEELGHAVAIDVREIARPADPVDLLLERVQGLEIGHLGERAFEPERLVAAEPVAVAEPARHQLVHRGRELGQVPAQPVVAQQRVHRVLELGPLLGRHRLEERLQRGHPLGELVDDVVEGLRAREERAVLGHELRDVRIAARDPFLEELVEVADHLPVGGELLRGRAPDRVRHATDELVEHLLAELLDQGVEALAGARLHEVVLLEAPDPAADVGRQLVELVEALGGRVAEHRPQRRIDRLLGARRRASPAASAAGRRLLPGGAVEPLLDPCPLLGDDLVQLAPDVGQHIAELVAVQQLLPAASQAVHAGRAGRPCRRACCRASASRAP